MGIIIRNGKQYGFSGKVGTASSVLYDNTNSQIELATVQEAIDYILENGVSGGGLLEVDLTKVEYEEMVAQDVIVDNVTYYITDDDDEYNASTIVYDNTDTGLESGNVQGAITEINAKVNEQNKKFTVKDYSVTLGTTLWNNHYYVDLDMKNDIESYGKVVSIVVVAVENNLPVFVQYITASKNIRVVSTVGSGKLAVIRVTYMK